MGNASVTALPLKWKILVISTLIVLGILMVTNDWMAPRVLRAIVQTIFRNLF